MYFQNLIHSGHVDANISGRILNIIGVQNAYAVTVRYHFIPRRSGPPDW